MKQLYVHFYLGASRLALHSLTSNQVSEIAAVSQKRRVQGCGRYMYTSQLRSAQ